MRSPPSPDRVRDTSQARERRSFTDREEAVDHREEAARLREEAVGLREEAAGLRAETARLREDSIRAREDTESVKAELNQLVMQLRTANQQLVISALRDQTLSDVAEQANRLKDEFLATVSHELRSPLTAILGWARMLRLNRLTSSRVEHAIDAIDRNAGSLAQLIEDLLDVSRITAGTLRIDSKPVSLTAVTQVAIETVKPMANAKAIDLRLSPAPAAELILGDARRLQQVVWNLLSNAIKFTPPGGRVDIDVRRMDSRLELRVSDTGQGIRADFLPLMFDRFRQADGAPSRREGGLGLGLSIVRQIVGLHGGEVQAESEGVDRGTTLTVFFPIPAGGVDSSSLSPVSDGGARSLGERPLVAVTVLLVERDDEERELNTLLLEAAGATVACVATAREAIAILDTLRPHVLVSSTRLPGEDGLALIHRIRSDEAGHGGFLPAIALTANRREDDRARALAAGYQAHVSKPATAGELERAIAAIAPTARARR